MSLEQELLEVLLSEYGVFVLVLLAGIVKLWLSNEQKSKRIDELSDKLLEIVRHDTETMTTLIERIDRQQEIQHARRGE